MKIIAVILAGGRSSRMGTLKPLLKIEGETLLDRVIRTLSVLKPPVGEIVISGSIPGRKTIDDENTFAGPVEGIRSVGKRYVGHADAMLVVPVDLPLLEAESLRPLIDKFVRGGAPALTFENHPLPAVFQLSEEFIEASKTESSVKGLLQVLGASTLEVSDPLFLSNANTPNDWAQITGVKL